MAWSETTQKQFMPHQRREGGYGTFSATSATLNVYTFMSKIHSIRVGYRTSGNSCAYDLPLTASATITTGYFVVTRPSVCGGASTIWYEITGQ